MANVRIERNGRAGLIVLDRPRAMNALTLSMVQDFSNFLADFERDPSVGVIILTSASPTAFCAGGDIRRIQELTLAERFDEADEFFATEYRLNKQIAECRTPYVSLIDGICMGGGMGLSVHGQFRAVTERAILSMPETSIGFFPDIGATYFLPRLPGYTGRWLGLTGARLSGEHAEYLGLATHRISSADLLGLQDELPKSTEEIEVILSQYSKGKPLNEGQFATHRANVDRWFQGDTLDVIFANLKGDPGPAAAEIAHQLQSAAPSSLKKTFELLEQGAASSLEECLNREREAAREAIRHSDFIEGVRAALVDKDRTPNWLDAS